MIRSWVALNAVKGLGPARIASLLQKYESPEALFKESPRALQAHPGVTAAVCARLCDPAVFDEAQRQCERAEKEGIEIVTLADARYPSLLREVFAPPPVLYVKGQIDAFSRHAVAMVGTRRPTRYGREAAEHLCRGLASRCVVVSGMALGIDTVAHRTTLDTGGTTIAVLGCGLDWNYPVSNRAMAEAISEAGALVSEFPLGTRPEGFNFPRRNRIISGLSAGTIVVEAPRRSGALITSHYALVQNRDVFAVPGPIFSPCSEGPNELIAGGAVPALSPQTVLEHLCAPSLDLPGGTAAKKMQSPVLGLLDKTERSVFEAIDGPPRRLDELAVTTGRDMSELFALLLNLELKGAVRQVAGQQYVRAV